MSNIIPFSSGNLPAYLTNKTAFAEINRDVVSGPSFSVLSIKGKAWTLVKDGQRKILTRPDDPDEALQSINLAVLRANTKARVFYIKAYSEEESEGAKPDCYSSDGVAPAADARSPQSTKCATCKHAVWGSKANADGKGTACAVNTRLAVADPDNLEEPILLRVPAGSRAAFADVVKLAESRSVPYNALVLKAAFDKEAPAPKITFKITGLLSDEAYTKASAMYESDEVKEVLGLNPKQALPAPAVEAQVEDEVGADELDAALQAKAAVQKAATQKPAKAVKPAPVIEDEVSVDEIEQVVAPKPAPAAKKVAKPAPAPVVEDDEGGDLLGDLDDLLASTDD